MSTSYGLYCNSCNTGEVWFNRGEELVKKIALSLPDLLLLEHTKTRLEETIGWEFEYSFRFVSEEREGDYGILAFLKTHWDHPLSLYDEYGKTYGPVEVKQPSDELAALSGCAMSSWYGIWHIGAEDWMVDEMDRPLFYPTRSIAEAQIRQWSDVSPCEVRKFPLP